MATTDYSYTLTQPTLATFPNVLEARAVMNKGKPSGEPKFSLNFEFPGDHPDLKPLKDLAVRVAKEAFPGVPLASLHFPFTSGDKLADEATAKGKEREWSRGRAVLVTRSKFEPAIGVILNGKLVAFEGDARPRAKPYFYTGVSAGGKITFQPYDTPQGKGVTAYLSQVVSLNTGERLTGAGGVEENDTFKGYIGIAKNEDPTGGAGLDDEIPF